MNDERACPHCAETIKLGAIYCKHCGLDVREGNASVERQTPAPAPVTVVYQNAVNSGPTTSGTASAALVLAFVVPIVGLILGYVAKSEIRKSDGAKTGEGLATAAIVIGWIFVAIAIVVVLVFAGSSN